MIFMNFFAYFSMQVLSAATGDHEAQSSSFFEDSDGHTASDFDGKSIM